MDRKSILILIVCFGLLLSWNTIVRKFWPGSYANNQTTTQSSVPGAASQGTNPSGEPAAFPSSSKAVPVFVTQTNVPEQSVVVTNENAIYTFTSRGGGLRSVQLLHYPETVATRRNRSRSTNQLATLNDDAATPVFAMVGDPTLQGDGQFTLTRTAQGVRAEKALSNGLTLVKEFQLSSNYLVSADIRWENRADKPLALPETDWVIGTSTPMGPRDNGQAELVMWFDGTKVAGRVPLSYFDTNTTRMWFFPRTPLTEYKEGASNIFWVSAQNQYFTLTTITATNSPGASVEVRMVELPKPSAAEIASTAGVVADPKGMRTELRCQPQTIAAGKSATLHFDLFAGPKKYETLAALNGRFNNEIDLVMNFGFFGGISRVLLLTMNWLYDHVLPSYGWIIILITVVIKMIFWPLTRASTRSMKRMQALQPQLKALQAKYKDDPAKFSQKQWEFYKKNKVNPFGGCLPMLLQIPVFFGLLTMLRNAIELRGSPFLWISDLSQPDTLFVVSFLGRNLPINLMPLVMGGTQFWLMSLTPPSPGMDPAQQKMMRYMPLIFVLFLYNYSSGLALYWTVSNLLSVLQTKVTKTQPATVPATPVPAAAAVSGKKK